MRVGILDEKPLYNWLRYEHRDLTVEKFKKDSLVGATTF